MKALTGLLKSPFRIRKNILKKWKKAVTSKAFPIQKVTGKYLSAEELHEWFEAGKEFYIIDMRNDYEYISGYFENFIPSEIHNFYDLPDVLPRLAHLKNKTVVT